MRLRRAPLLFVLIGCNASYAGLSDYEAARSDTARDKILIADVRQQRQAQEQPKAEVAKPESEHNNQPLLELHSQIETLKLDLNKLQGQIEVLVNESDLTQKRQKDFYIDLDDRLRRIEQRRGLVDSGSAAPGSAGLEESETQPETDLQPAPPVPEHSASGAGASPGSSLSADLPADADMGERGAYEAAYSLFKAGKYKDAIARFNEFLKVYPNSNLAPSAQYWIGNAYYALRDFNNAISAQEKLINTYPDSAKAPDAMLNIASSQQETSERTAAQKTLESVIATYPGSDAAEKAKQRLINLK